MTKLDYKNRYEYISNIKAIATLMVVFLHSVSPLFYQHGQIGNAKWFITVFYDSLVRPCVPLFLIVNGSLILGKDYKLRQWITKIIKRLFLPFLFYSLLALLVYKKSLLNIFILDKIAYWFPFFGIILSLYLVYPAVNIWIKRKHNMKHYFLIIWVSSVCLSFWFPKFNLFSTNAIYLYLGYPVLGYYLDKINTRKYKKYGLLTYIIFALLTFYLVLISNKPVQANEKYFEFLSPNVIVMSLGLFIYLKDINKLVTNKIIASIRNFLSNHSYGIYFLHPLVLNRLYFLHASTHPVFSGWIIFTLGISLTCLIIYTLSRISSIKPLLG